MRLMQSIANNKVKYETTLPATIVIEKLRCPKHDNKEMKWRIAPCARS